MLMEAIRSSETSVLTRTTRRHIPEDDILHHHRCKNVKSYIALTGGAMKLRGNVSSVKYKLGFYIQKTVYFTLTAVKTSCEVRTGFFFVQKTAFFIVTAVKTSNLT
jgi:hypothetical protein